MPMHMSSEQQQQYNVDIQILIQGQKLMLERVDDHEKRIRFIERTISYGLGVAGALTVLWDILKGRLQ